ncbi:MAG: transglutaminase-like domain-containing protein [Longimicrobiales bacterium]
MRLRTIIGPAVVIAWVGVLGLHVRREYFKSSTTLLAEGARSLAPGRFWYAVKMNDVTIGMGSSRLDTVAGGFNFQDEMTLDVPALGTTHRSRAVTDLTLSSDLSLKSFRFDLLSEIGNFSVSGLAAADSSIALVMDAGGEKQRTSIKADRGLLLDAAIPLRLAAANAYEVGKEFTVRVFDPSAMAARDVTMKVTSRDTIIVPDSAVKNAQGKWVPSRYDSIPAWKLEQRFGGVIVTTWVDDDGQIVRATSPLGFTIERTYYELVRQDWNAGRKTELAAGYGALIQGTAISSNIDVAALEDQTQLRVRLGGVDLQGFDLEGGRQRLHGDTLVITREAAVPRAPYQLPYRGKDSIAIELEATPLIQVNDPEIVAAARRIVGNNTDPVEASRRLTTWVYDKLEKDVTLSVPSARQVLDAKKGDCNEHTVLYVALARAVGLPARTAVGLVYLRGHFYYHAWPEVWLGEWVAVDPTLGQYPADASHLRFILGGLARQVELIRLIGRLQLEVI